MREQRLGFQAERELASLPVEDRTARGRNLYLARVLGARAIAEPLATTDLEVRQARTDSRRQRQDR
jgi:hypothetical protein